MDELSSNHMHSAFAADEDMSFSPFISPARTGQGALVGAGEGPASSLSALDLSPSMFSPDARSRMRCRESSSQQPPHMSNMIFSYLMQQEPAPRPTKSSRPAIEGGPALDPHAQQQQGNKLGRGGGRDLASAALPLTFMSPASGGRSPRMPVTLSPPIGSAPQASHCNCKKSKCLKLYCECFASLRYCISCNCHDCNNTNMYEAAREDAIKSTKERNSSAFVTKVNSGRGHTTGCHCKNSLCLKKYCECFQAGAYCATNCKCLSCQNFAGSQSLGSLRAAASSSERDRRRKGSPTSVAATVSENNTPTEAMGGSGSFDSAGQPLPTARRSSGRFRAGNAAALAAEEHARQLSLKSWERPDSNPGAGMAHMGFNDNLISFEGSGLLEPEPLSQSARKKRRWAASEAPPVYPFFGAPLPSITKRVALSVLDFLGNADLYSLSLTSSYWARAAVDEALWAPQGESMPLPYYYPGFHLQER